MKSNSTAFLIKIKLRHSLGRPSRSDFVQSEFMERLAMKKKNPQKNLIISWIVIGAGIFFATIGAVTAQDYKLNLWLWIGFLTIIAGIVYHLVMVKCPYCGHSLVGYRPFPKECPKCHKKFEFEKLE